MTSFRDDNNNNSHRLLSLKCVFKDGWTEQQCKNVNFEGEQREAGRDCIKPKNGVGDRRHWATKKWANLVEERTVPPFLIRKNRTQHENKFKKKGNITVHHIKALSDLSPFDKWEIKGRDTVLGVVVQLNNNVALCQKVWRLKWWRAVAQKIKSKRTTTKWFSQVCYLFFKKCQEKTNGRKLIKSLFVRCDKNKYSCMMC